MVTTSVDRVRAAESAGTALHEQAAQVYRDCVAVDRGCWGWSGYANHHGYGVVRFMRERVNTYVLAHRLSYVIHHGPIPAGLHVLHSCDNKRCTNPLHLRVGTDRENSQDAMIRGRVAKKVPPAVIDELAGKVARGEMTQREAAEQAGVAHSAVHNWVKVRRARGLL